MIQEVVESEYGLTLLEADFWICSGSNGELSMCKHGNGFKSHRSKLGSADLN
jgi:hypothetical protein